MRVIVRAHVNCGHTIIMCIGEGLGTEAIHACVCQCSYTSLDVGKTFSASSHTVYPLELHSSETRSISNQLLRYPDIIHHFLTANTTCIPTPPSVL